MKKRFISKKVNLLLILLTLSYYCAYSQPNAYWQINGNNALSLPPPSQINANSFIGSTDPNIPFNLRTTQAQPMLFQTNGLTNRMLIDFGGNGGLNGRIAMGNNLPANFVPLDRLHLHHTDNSNVFTRFTNLQSIAGGSSIGIVATTGFDNELRIVQFETQPIRFFNGGSAFYIMPQGRTYVGRQTPGTPVLANRFTIDSDAGDASKSGLRICGLNQCRNPGSQPGSGSDYSR